MKKIKNVSVSTIIILLVVSILSGIFGATAATKLFNSNEIGYDNTASGIQSTDLQGAVDELYAAATTYESLATRIANVEKYARDNATSFLREYGIELNADNGGSTVGGYIDFHWQGSASDYTSRIVEYAQGKINIMAPNGVYANGKSISTYSTKTYTNATYGLSLDATRNGNTVTLYIYPTNTALTSQISSAGAYVDVFTIDDIYRPAKSFVNYSLLNNMFYGQFNVANNGLVRIGHTRRFDAPTTNTSLASGQGIWAVVTYTGKQI